jgi:hypothetical protein
MAAGRILDCDAGRAMGCATFCCRLLVRLDPGERDPGNPTPSKSCLDKDPDSGLCVYLDASTQRCTVWAQRPRVCREYDCNADPNLQRVLREGYRSLTRLALASDIPAGEDARRVPVIDAPVKPSGRRRRD